MADADWKDAEKAVAEAIVKRAKGGKDAENTPSSEDLQHLAEGVAALKWGPQGGEKRSDTTTDYTYTGKTESTSSDDIHRTEHQGEDRERPPTGFGKS